MEGLTMTKKKGNEQVLDHFQTNEIAAVAPNLPKLIFPGERVQLQHFRVKMHRNINLINKTSGIYISLVAVWFFQGNPPSP